MGWCRWADNLNVGARKAPVLGLLVYPWNVTQGQMLRPVETLKSLLWHKGEWEKCIKTSGQCGGAGRVYQGDGRSVCHSDVESWTMVMPLVRLVEIQSAPHCVVLIDYQLLSPNFKKIGTVTIHMSEPDSGAGSLQCNSVWPTVRIPWVPEKRWSHFERTDSICVKEKHLKPSIYFESVVAVRLRYSLLLFTGPVSASLQASSLSFERIRSCLQMYPDSPKPWALYLVHRR